MHESSEMLSRRPPIGLRPLESRSVASESAPPTEGSAVVRGVQLITARSPNVRIPSCAGFGQPQVQLVRDGDTVVAIDVTCGCGSKMRLVCEYDGDG